MSRLAGSLSRMDTRGGFPAKHGNTGGTATSSNRCMRASGSVSGGCTLGIEASAPDEATSCCLDAWHGEVALHEALPSRKELLRRRHRPDARCDADACCGAWS